ncbi:PIN domain-containing protein [Aureimonas psammosilenae]|uniref:PIN domain-containing protein n=1 Tax=Aureimonas psammosilenae TaxID=2495496 RepID=UPI001260C4E7|nr:PIN domain-containing protein [Aureimonas psammosilenae]
MKYLLDTNIISAIIRDPEGRAGRIFAETRRADVGTSIIAAAELRYGYVKIASRRWEHIVEATLATMTVVAWDRPADMAYARLRTEAERQGVTVGQNDMLIAAHASALGAMLVSDDRIFPRIAELRVENWLRAGPNDF